MTELDCNNRNEIASRKTLSIRGWDWLASTSDTVSARLESTVRVVHRWFLQGGSAAQFQWRGSSTPSQLIFAVCVAS